MRELTIKDKTELNQKARRHGLPTLWPEADMGKMLNDLWRQQAKSEAQQFVDRLRIAGAAAQSITGYVTPPPSTPWHRFLWPF